MASLKAAKQALRVQLKQRLAALSDVNKAQQSKAVTLKLLSHSNYRNAQRIAVFLNMPDEIQTAEIISDIFQQGKTCFIPRYKPRSNHMDMVRLRSLEEIQQLPVTSWNIRQPEDGESREDALFTGGLDLVLVPGLGFDKEGHRLGRGKGFYDTFFERYSRQLAGKPHTIALAFQEQLCESIPVTEHDIEIDEILCAGDHEDMKN
ncbi:5-formyltetrahydrofolate cyclo-ligase [Pelobates cultripes]|uniref:5-formyltetrahydrofolate cyclo-ligase n=2 Tax=Pelobates cultripes TaxID=61616 RepID=A0AAD1VWV9_PELCU|nr:5-formyltetrahydrofolate cyclo-ligase [Pelobates cultripes]